MLKIATLAGVQQSVHLILIPSICMAIANTLIQLQQNALILNCYLPLAYNVCDLCFLFQFFLMENPRFMGCAFTVFKLLGSANQLQSQCLLPICLFLVQGISIFCLFVTSWFAFSDISYNVVVSLNQFGVLEYVFSFFLTCNYCDVFCFNYE